MQGRSHSGHGQHTGSVSGFHQGHEGDLQGRRYGWAPPSAPHCPSNHHLRTTQPGSQDYPVALYEGVVTAPFLSEAPCNKATGRRVRELRLRPPSRHGQESQARQGYHIQTSWSSWPSISWLCMDCLWRECLVISTTALQTSQQTQALLQGLEQQGVSSPQAHLLALLERQEPGLAGQAQGSYGRKSYNAGDPDPC